MRGFFITATGTGVGKTFVTRAFARALRRRGERVAAIKPLETGCRARADDALALAAACERHELADAPGLYRAPLPLAPYAATLAGCPPPPAVDALAATVHDLARGSDLLLVEGAGGLLVPVDERHDTAHLAAALGLPLLLVTTDGLGVLSHTLAAIAAARAHRLPVAGVILSRHSVDPLDPSTSSNRRILGERLPDTPVLPFPRCADDDEALATAAESWGLLELLPA